MVPSKFSLGFLNTKYQINPNPKPGKVNNHDNVDLDKNYKNVWMLMDWKISGISAHAVPIRILTPVKPRSDLWPRCANVDTWSDRVGSHSLAITTSYAKKRRLGSCYVILSELEILTWLSGFFDTEPVPQSISGQSTLSVKLFVYTLGVKLSWCQIVRLHSWCQIVCFTPRVSNCPFYTLGVKLSPNQI